MALKTTTIVAQYPLVAFFSANLVDTMVDTSAATTAFKAASGVFDVIELPIGAEVIGGYVAVLTASDETGYSLLDVGDASDTDRYTSQQVSLSVAGRTPLDVTGYKTVAASRKLRLTFTNENANAAAGSVKVVVQYVSEEKTNEPSN